MKKSIKKFFHHLWSDESGQGAMEYILMLVVVGAIVIAFKKPILEAVGNLTTQTEGKLRGAIDSVQTQ